jgi:hypothetical protein
LKLAGRALRVNYEAFLFKMKFLEKDLEEIIFSTDNSELLNRGLYLYKNKIKQLKLGNYGICDILAWEKHKDYFHGNILKIQIIELKQNEINFHTLSQSLRYARAIQRYLQFRKSTIVYQIDIVLIGKIVNDIDSTFYLPTLFNSNEDKYHAVNNINIYSYMYEIDGLYFHDFNDVYLKNEGFAKKQNVVNDRLIFESFLNN